jgi:MFS family permease
MSTQKTGQSFFEGLKGIIGLRREFWGIQILVLTDWFAVYAILGIMMDYLKESFELSDPEATLYMSVFTTGSAVMSFVLGFLIDRFGYRKMMMIGAVVATVGRLGLGFVPLLPYELEASRILSLVFLGIMATGGGFFLSMSNAGSKRFAPSSMSTSAFNVLGFFLQMGPFLAGFFLQWAGDNQLPYSNIFFVAAGFSSLVFALGYFFMKDERAEMEGGEKAETQKMSTFVMLKQLIREKSFWMIVLLLAMLIGGRMAFGFLHPLMIPYYRRVSGGNVDLGYLLMINPFLIGVGFIVLLKWFKRFHPYWRVLVGLTIVGTSMLLLAIPPDVPQRLFNLNLKSAYYFMFIAQIMVFAVGEMVWSPSFRQLVMSQAPKEKVSIYSGLLSATGVPGRFLVTALSGFMLAQYCPKNVHQAIKEGTLSYTQSPEMMFVIIGAVALTGPLFLLLARRWYYKDEEK